jgi:hypothetical protein
VAEHLVSIELVPAPRPGKWAKAITYGDVQAAYACANEVAKEAFDSLLPKATWKYLSKLNSWCNRQLHEAELPKVGGRVKLVCPGDCLDDVALLQAAAMIGLDADVLVSDQVSPDVSLPPYLRGSDQTLDDTGVFGGTPRGSRSKQSILSHKCD